MCKKVKMLLAVVALFMLTGCTNESVVENVDDQVEVVENTTAKVVVEVVEESTEVKESNQVETTTVKEENENTEEQITEVENFKRLTVEDVESLKDSDLIKAFYENYSYVDNYMTVTKQEFNEIISYTTSYYLNRNIRYETKTDEYNVIMISNISEGANYQYVEGDGTGMVTYTNNSNEPLDSGESGVAPDNMGDNTKAELSQLNGEDTILITMEYDSLNYKSLTWLSVEKGIALKSDTYQDDKIVNSVEVIEYRELTTEDMYLFDKPEGIEFK